MKLHAYAAVGGAFALALIHPATAGAALCVRWEPPVVRPDGQVIVALHTLTPLPSGELRPEAAPGYPFRVVVSAPDGATRSIELRQDASDPVRWVGRFVAEREGAWTVRVANFEEAAVSPACYEPLRVDVGHESGIGSSLQDADARSAWVPWTLSGAAIALALAAAAWLVARRRRV